MIQNVHLRFSLVFLAVLFSSLSATAPAQSLGEVARQCHKEREAREKEGEGPVKVFTNDDIARMPPIAILESSMRSPSSPEAKPSAPPGKAKSCEKSKEYWQAKFKAARARLSHAKAEQTLVEDELHLLQIQQARELNPDRSRKLNGKIDASTVELESKRAATEKAQKAMEQLEKEFKDSGAPQNWIQGSTKPD